MFYNVKKKVKMLAPDMLQVGDRALCLLNKLYHVVYKLKFRQWFYSVKYKLVLLDKDL